MKRTILFTVCNESGRFENNNLFYANGDYRKAVFPDGVDVTKIIPLVVHGKTYQDRKNYLRNLALDVMSNIVGGLSYMEQAEMDRFFEKAGRRYGLLSEFRENAIC